MYCGIGNDFLLRKGVDTIENILVCYMVRLDVCHLGVVCYLTM